jgi:hypothetical protein
MHENPFENLSVELGKPIVNGISEKAAAAATTSGKIETPTKQSSSFVGRVFGSLRKVVWGAPAEQADGTNSSPSSPPSQSNPFEPNFISPRPRHTPRAARKPENVSPFITKDEWATLQAARKSKTDKSGSSKDTPAKEQPSHDLHTSQVEGSNKRKFDEATEERPAKRVMLNADENGNITGSFGLTDDMLEYSDDDEQNESDDEITYPNIVEEVNSPHVPAAPPTTPAARDTDLANFQPRFLQKTQHLRSAMKTGKSPAKKVGFDVNMSTTKTVYPDYGPAGEYTGSMFQYPKRDPKEAPPKNPFTTPNPTTPAESTPSHIDVSGTIRNTTKNAAFDSMHRANIESQTPTVVTKCQPPCQVHQRFHTPLFPMPTSASTRLVRKHSNTNPNNPLACPWLSQPDLAHHHHPPLQPEKPWTRKKKHKSPPPAGPRGPNYQKE